MHQILKGCMGQVRICLDGYNNFLLFFFPDDSKSIDDS